MCSSVLRPGNPRSVVFLRPSVSEQSGGARESLRGAAAGTSNGPNAPTRQLAPLGCMPGLREAAAAGLSSSYTNLLSICVTVDEKPESSFQPGISTGLKVILAVTD